jgi:hypothetical protein
MLCLLHEESSTKFEIRGQQTSKMWTKIVNKVVFWLPYSQNTKSLYKCSNCITWIEDKDSFGNWPLSHFLKNKKYTKNGKLWKLK